MSRQAIRPARHWSRFAIGLWLIAGVFAAGCRTATPPVATTPQYPGYILPTLTPPDPRQEQLVRQHEIAWRWLQGGDLARAEQGFQAVLKRSPGFYPSEAALGYVQLAARSYAAALERFDRVLQSRAQYVPALVGRGKRCWRSRATPRR